MTAHFVCVGDVHRRYVVANTEVCVRFSLGRCAIELKLEHNVQNGLSLRSITFLLI